MDSYLHKKNQQLFCLKFGLVLGVNFVLVLVLRLVGVGFFLFVLEQQLACYVKAKLRRLIFRKLPSETCRLSPFLGTHAAET